jgi:signal transduction histidine kinase
MELYDKAIAGAKENEYIQEEALANELAAKFYLSLGRKKVAQAYMIEAYYCYSHWGAKAKVKDLEERYPKLLAAILEQQKISLNPFKTIASLGKTTSHTQATISSNTTGISDALDFTSVMKASQALSSEIELNQLISQLMQIMMENAGANKGVLMLSQGSQLIVEAISTHRFSDDSIISTTQTSIPVEESLEVPLSVINSVKRSLKTLNLDDISNQTQFGSDSYLMQQQPQSLLCLPLCNRGEFLGILYLENNLTIGAFTDERVQVLKLLCSQAAISLENAQLYQKSQDYAQQLEQSLKDLQEAQVQLVQSEKMSALGQMMAGIAHEINNPVGFIGGNITHAEEYLQDLIEHLNLYQNYCLEAHPEIAEHAAEIDLEYLLEDLPELISSMKTGVNRIKNISTSMRTFSRSDTDHKVEFNLHEGIDSTLLILKHRLKANEKRSDIQVVKNYGNLPQIMGYPGQLNQVFMNIIANAIDVFDEAKNIENPQITITTELIKDGKNVWIKIQDNGLGMSEEVQQKVFDHLFTTKPVGKGTGLGLSISRQIVEDKHGGILKCSSQVGEGTEFIIQIPNLSC